MKPSTVRPHQRGLTLVEVLVIISIVGICLFLLVGRHTVISCIAPSRPAALMQQGVQIYKAIFTQYLVDTEAQSPTWLFPSQSNRFASSTAYFRALVTNEILRVDYSFFSGPGLGKIKTTDPTAFLPANNAWNVCLDVENEIASMPFLFSRNLLAQRTLMVASNETLTVDMLGEPKSKTRLDFDRDYAVVITKAGMGFTIKRNDFKEGQPADRINPTPYRGPFLKP